MLVQGSSVTLPNRGDRLVTDTSRLAAALADRYRVERELGQVNKLFAAKARRTRLASLRFCVFAVKTGVVLKKECNRE